MTKITLLGDIMLGRSFNEISPNKEWINSDLKEFIRDSDLIVGNLETTITTSNKKWPNKVFNFKANPIGFEKRIREICENKICFLSLANNHSLDYSEEGLLDTMNTLDNLNIYYGGTINLNPIILKIKDRYIIIFAASDHPKDFGLYIEQNFDKLNNNIRFYRFKYPNALIIVSVHWGPNYTPEPTLFMKTLGHLLIDNGANIIHGTSPHHLLSMENYRNGLIVYSMGDFIDDYAIDDNYRNDLSAVLKLIIDDNNNIFIEIYPTKISHLSVGPSLNQKEYQYSIDLLTNKIAPGFGV